MPIFDIHAYYGETSLSASMASREAILASMRRSEITQLALISSLAARCDFIGGNRRLSEVVDAESGLYGWICLNSDYSAESQEEQRRYLMRPEFVGGVLFGQGGAPVTAGRARDIINAHRRFTKPMAIYAPNSESVHAAADIAAEFPTMKFVLLAMGGEDWRTAVAAAKRQINLYLEASGSLDSDKISHAVATLTQRKLLFGSGLPYRDPELTLGLIAEATGLTGPDRARILSQNAQALFNAQANPA